MVEDGLSEITGVVLKNSWLPENAGRISLYTYEGIGSEYLIEQNEFEVQLRAYIKKTAKIKCLLSKLTGKVDSKKSLLAVNFLILKDELFDNNYLKGEKNE